jgi:hypothetical protein
MNPSEPNTNQTVNTGDRYASSAEIARSQVL